MDLYINQKQIIQKHCHTLKKALQIQENSLPINHPEITTTYNNLDSLHDSMGNYSTALSYYEKTLEIQEKSFLLDNPSSIPILKNIAIHIRSALSIQRCH